MISNATPAIPGTATNYDLWKEALRDLVGADNCHNIARDRTMQLKTLITASAVVGMEDRWATEERRRDDGETTEKRRRGDGGRRRGDRGATEKRRGHVQSREYEGC